VGPDFLLAGSHYPPTSPALSALRRDRQRRLYARSTSSYNLRSASPDFRAEFTSPNGGVKPPRLVNPH